MQWCVVVGFKSVSSDTLYDPNNLNITYIEVLLITPL